MSAMPLQPAKGLPAEAAMLTYTTSVLNRVTAFISEHKHSVMCMLGYRQHARALLDTNSTGATCRVLARIHDLLRQHYATQPAAVVVQGSFCL